MLKNIFNVKKLFPVILLTVLAPQTGFACTGFGAITKTGTIIGKNRDYFYNPQKFGLLTPMESLYDWKGNTYHHQNHFYALIGVADTHYEFNATEDVSMGVNEHGLTAIEEDTMRPKEKVKQRLFFQPNNGTDVNTVLYAALQNFNTIDEMVPYLSKIFSTAAPDFYQFSDAKKILTVEVAFGDNNQSPQRKFSYQILSKKNEQFGHTNTYISPEFLAINKLYQDELSLNGLTSAKSRLAKINTHLAKPENKNIESTSTWFLDTRSAVSDEKNQISCLNTSLFRSDLKSISSINLNQGTRKFGGTVSSMIVSNNGDFKHSYFYLKMLDSITIDKNHNQLIKYKELKTTLEKLFDGSTLNFVDRQFIRMAPVNGVCE